MKELKDIVLKEGDRVIWSDGVKIIYDGSEVRTSEYTEYIDEIIKIERPVKYETIYEAPKQMLDKKEKEWLENFLRPFKFNIIYIEKYISLSKNYYIKIYFNAFDSIQLPEFEKDKYYKGMKLNKEYTLKELGLFE